MLLELLLDMASVWKHPESQYWTACFRDQNGKQRRVTTKATDRKKAKAIADALEKAVRTKRTLRQAQVALDRLHEEIAGQKVSRKSLREFAKDWLETKVPETAPRTHVFYVASISKLISFLGKRALEPLGEITKADVIAYRNHLAKQLSPSTANHDLKVTRSHNSYHPARREARGVLAGLRPDARRSSRQEIFSHPGLATCWQLVQPVRCVPWRPRLSDTLCDLRCRPQCEDR